MNSCERVRSSATINLIFMRDLADLAPPVVKTGGAQNSEMAEGSQICDFREAKVDATCKALTGRARAWYLEWCNVVMEVIGVKKVIEVKVVLEVIGVTYIRKVANKF